LINLSAMRSLFFSSSLPDGSEEPLGALLPLISRSISASESVSWSVMQFFPLRNEGGHLVGSPRRCNFGVEILHAAANDLELAFLTLQTPPQSVRLRKFIDAAPQRVHQRFDGRGCGAFGLELMPCTLKRNVVGEQAAKSLEVVARRTFAVGSPTRLTEIRVDAR